MVCKKIIGENADSQRFLGGFAHISRYQKPFIRDAKMGDKINMNIFWGHLIAGVLFFSLATTAFAHQSGCHRWHSCPSDTGSYVCGDLGYTSQCGGYFESSYSPSNNSYDYTYPATPSCPSNSYYDGISSCKCNYGYVVSGGSCVSGTSYCTAQLGIMSQYNSLYKKCECMSGYVFDGSSCVYESSNRTYSGYAPTLNDYEFTATTQNTKESCVKIMVRAPF